MARHYKDLIAWQKAMDLVAALYDATEAFPKRETYSLTDQMRRAAVSIPSNIADGQAHFTSREFRHLLRHYADHSQNSRLRYSLLSAGTTRLIRKPLSFSVVLTKWAAS